MWTIADILKLIFPYVPEVLVPLSHRMKLLAATERLPGTLTHCVDLECRLGQAQASTDLPFCITPDERSALARLSELSGFDKSILNSPAWQRLLAFSAEWADGTNKLHDRVENVWLEYDLDADDPSLEWPHLFVGSKKIPAPGPRWTQPDRWLYQSALPALAGAEIPPKTVSTLRRVLDNLPPGAHLYQAGLFARRPDPHIRVCLAGIAPSQTISYLQKIGYPHDLKDIARVLADYTPLCIINLACDVTTAIGPKLGLELTRDRKDFNALPRKDAGLLDFLVRQGLCSVEQQAALLAFPGFQDSRLSSLPWPEMPAPGERAQPGAASVLRREFSHVKLVYQPGLPPEAKAYLQVVNDWLPPTLAGVQMLAYQAREQETNKIIKGLHARQTI